MGEQAVGPDVVDVNGGVIAMDTAGHDRGQRQGASIVNTVVVRIDHRRDQGPDMDLHSGIDLQLTIGEALGTDYFGLREPFTPQQEDYLTRTRAFVDTEVLPVINDFGRAALALRAGAR